jgi:hypothetical protein
MDRNTAPHPTVPEILRRLAEVQERLNQSLTEPRAETETSKPPAP